MDDGNLSRRDFLRGRVLPTLPGTTAEHRAPPNAKPPKDAVPSARYTKSFPVLRPPGAVEEEDFLAGCTKCEACVKACPHDAIIHAPARFRRAAETPMIDPIRQPCWMCQDYPCITACEPGVLRRDYSKRMATARIEEFSCLAWQGSACTACSDQCPVPGAMAVEQGKPRIVEDVCTGCGVCQFVCPAPANTILLMPVSTRPPRPVPNGGF